VDPNAGSQHREAIIEPGMVSAAVGEARLCRVEPRQPLELLDAEPALKEFLEEGLLKMAGRMALDGAPPPIVRAIHEEASFLLAVTFNAVCHAYRSLYEDLLPQTESESSTVQTETPSPSSNAGGNSADVTIKKEPKS